MTKFRYDDWSDIRSSVSHSRISILDKLNAYQTAVEVFCSERDLKGDAWNAAREYIELTTPISKGIRNVLTDVGSMLDQYIGDFESSVGQTSKDFDSDKLQSLQDDLNRVRSMKKASIKAAQINLNLPGGDANPYQGGLSTGVFDSSISQDNSEIKILKLYDNFEERHINDYGSILDALSSIQQGIKELNNPKNFDSETGEFSKKNFDKEEWYQKLNTYNSISRVPAMDVKVKQVKLAGDGLKTGDVQYIYEVYIDGKYNKDGSIKLQKLNDEAGRNFVMELLGVTDFVKAISGKDPFTGKKISSQERAKAIFWSVIMLVPVGKAAEVFKGAKGVISGIKIDRSALRSVKAYTIPEHMNTILKENEISAREFSIMNTKEVKTVEDVSILKKIREEVPSPNEDTVMRKVIPTDYIDGIVNNSKYKNVTGFITDKSYVENITSTNDVIESIRLDYKGSLIKKNGDYAYIDFTSQNISSTDIPYNPKFGGNVIKEPPFTGTGFTGSRNGTIVPEWKTLPDVELRPSVGSEIHKVVGNEDRVVARYGYDSNTKTYRWRKI